MTYQLGGVSPNGVFADYLSVTFNPDNSPVDLISQQLQEWSWHRKNLSDDVCHLTYPTVSTGKPLITIVKNYKRTVDRFSVSGGALHLLRATTLYAEIIALIYTCPHNVTRLDLALDVPQGTPDTLRNCLNRMYRKARQGQVALGREPVKDIVHHKAPRPFDDMNSGTISLGKRQNRYSCVIYDKRLELFARQGLISATLPGGKQCGEGKEYLRYEMRTSEACLRDAWEGDSLFFRLASPDLLVCPPDVPEWTKTEMPPLNLTPPVKRTDFERMSALIDHSADLDALANLLSQNPALLPMAERRLEQRLKSSVKANSLGVRKIA